MPRIDFLFISNGYGEDAIAAKIAEPLREKFRVAAFPLVGEGLAYAKKGIEVAGKFPALPGGGVSFWRDFRGGLTRLVVREWSALRKLRPEVSRVVAVGDIVPAVAACWALRKKFAYAGTARSVYVEPCNIFEEWIMRKADAVFARDESTRDFLNKRGIAARWVGNPMMDETAELSLKIPEFEGTTIGILPGSRSDAVHNFPLQAKALGILQERLGRPVRGIVAIPPMIPPGDFLAKIPAWDGAAAGPVEPAASTTPSGIIGDFVLGGSSMLFAADCLGDVLRGSAIVFGQAGTANEQAAGLGKPVVAFDLFENKKLSWYRWRQKRLLGKALEVVWANAEALAEKGEKILSDPALHAAMAEDGMKRQGPPGGAAKISAFLANTEIGDTSR